MVAAACFPVGLGKSYNSMIMSHIIICHIFGYLMWFLFVFYIKDNLHLPVVVGVIETLCFVGICARASIFFIEKILLLYDNHWVCLVMYGSKVFSLTLMI